MKTPATPALGALWLLVLAVWLLAPGKTLGVQERVVELTAAMQRVILAPQVDILEDRAGVLTAREVAEAPDSAFRAAGTGLDALNFGYSTSTFWLRVRLAGRPDAPRHWLLEIAYPTLDRIEVHAGSNIAVAGDLSPFAARPLAHRNFVFPVELPPHGELTLLVRVQSAGSMTVPLTLWQHDAFDKASKDAYVALSVYFGMLLALMLYNLLLYLSVRDANFLRYVLFVLGMAVGQLSANGLGNEFLWPHWPSWGNAAFPIGFATTGIFGALFARSFLDTPRHAPRVDRLLLGLVVMFAGGIVMTALVSYRLGALVISLTGVCFSIAAVLAGFLSLRAGHAGARWFLIAWSLLLLGVAVLGLRNFGWLPTTFLTAYGMQIGSALEMLMLSFALADRLNILQIERDRAQREAIAAGEALVATLRDSERQLEQRVAERTAALASANAELQARRSQLEQVAHHDPLTGLANRLLLDLRLEHALQRARRNDLRLAVLLLDLDAFKPVNDRYGHAVGDDVLKEVARRLAGAVRASDTVARLGGDEFVVVLEDLPDTDEAGRVAAKIVADLAREIVVDGLRLKIGASAGLAFYPGHGDNARALVQQADAAMYRAKQSGRGCFVVAGA